MGKRFAPRIGIVGKGALGLLYAHQVTRRLGPGAVTFAMDAGRLARHAGEEYTINGEKVAFADATPEEIGTCDLVICSTKATGLAEAIELARPLVGPDTVVISVLNGLRSEELIARRFGWEHVVGCVAQGMDAARFGGTLRYSREGTIFVGTLPQTVEALGEDGARRLFSRCVEILDEAGIGYTLDADIVRRMWTKFIINVGINQCCAAYGLPYSGILADETTEQFRTYVACMREVVAVAQAEGIDLGEKDINDALAIERTLDPASTPSMGQDRINRVPSEVDEFAGEVMRRAERHGILVPANAWLMRRMREIEAEY